MDRGLVAGGLQVLGVLASSHALAALLGIAPPTPLDRYATAWLTAIGMACLEELVFRGLLFEVLRRTVGLAAAIGGSALAFGLVHPSLPIALAAALLGLQLGALRAVHGLGWAIAAHAINNGVLLVVPHAALEPDVASLAIAAIVAGSAWAALAHGLASPRCGATPGRDPLGALQRTPQSDE